MQRLPTNKHIGQFFTPESITKLMANMTMPNELPDEATVCDPACGSGRFLIEGIRKNRYANFVGVDLDLTCVHMTAINCVLRNANTWIVHGNSISLEAFGGYRVVRTWAGGEIFKLTPEQARAVIVIPKREPAEQTQAIEKVQQEFEADKRGQFDLGF